MSELTLKIKLRHPDAKVPQYAHPGDSGMDLFAHNCLDAGEDFPEYGIVFFPGSRVLVGTGISIELPPGTEAQVRSRSGLALKSGIIVLNSPGTVDRGYRGEIGVILINLSQSPVQINKGDKIAQLVIAPVLHPAIQVVGELTETDRGVGGFGSTGVAG